jgi:hypothetical protein
MKERAVHEYSEMAKSHGNRSGAHPVGGCFSVDFRDL